MFRHNRKTGGLFHLRGPSQDEKDLAQAREFLRQRAFNAIIKGSKYLHSGGSGFTVLHDDATGSIYDINRPQDVATLHNVLPREDLFIIAKDNNNELLDSFATGPTTPWSIVEEYGAAPGYRVTTTGGWINPTTHATMIDHGMLIATDLASALAIGKKWNQQAVLELDNRGDALKVDFHDVTS